MSVGSFDGKSYELRFTDIGKRSEFDESVQRHLDVRKILKRLVKEVSHDAPEDGLVSHQQHIALSLQLHHNWFQPSNKILDQDKNDTSS